MHDDVSSMVTDGVVIFILLLLLKEDETVFDNKSGRFNGLPQQPSMGNLESRIAMLPAVQNTVLRK